MTLTIRHDGIRMTAPADAQRERGVPEEAIAEAARAARAKLVSAECRARILAVADEHDQTNLVAAHSAAAAVAKTERSDGEAAVIAVFPLAIGWIKAMRETYRALTNDADADYEADGAWPPVPDGVADVIAAL